MRMRRAKDWQRAITLVICCCLLFLSACQSIIGPLQQGNNPPAPTKVVEQNPTAITFPRPPQTTPSVVPTPTQGTPPVSTPVATNGRPVLAFYYMWYKPSTWCLCQMSDMPTDKYNSNDDSTIARQVKEAAGAGITGFIASWWGPGDNSDKNFVKLLAQSANFERSTGYHFTSAVYIENSADALHGTDQMINGLQYVIAHYANSPYYFHWRGKPVIFFTSPIPGDGRSLSTWASIRSQVDPNDQTIWSAEGVDVSVLSVFDGIHLFSAGYWGILGGNMAAVDQEFSNKVAAYNAAHHTQKIWAAGVLPGYNDTRVPGRTGTYVVPRNDGATYHISWDSAMASNPEWITITTFNEWFEGAMIEPSVTYGNMYLNLTLQYVNEWRR
jgi:hypothetical protein